MEPGEYDVGNKYFAGQEAMVIFDNVFNVLFFQIREHFRNEGLVMR